MSKLSKIFSARAWIISVTIFLPQSGNISAVTVILTLIVYLSGSYLGTKFLQRRNVK